MLQESGLAVVSLQPKDQKYSSYEWMHEWMNETYISIKTKRTTTFFASEDIRLDYALKQRHEIAVLLSRAGKVLR